MENEIGLGKYSLLVASLELYVKDEKRVISVNNFLQRNRLIRRFEIICVKFRVNHSIKYQLARYWLCV